MDDGKAVLLVEDDLDFAANLIDIFDGHGLRLEEARTGAEGIQAARQGCYSLILLDLRLPDLPGIEVMRKIKRISPDTEVIVETGYASLETAVQALDLGAFSYVIKPVNPEYLVALCERALEHAEIRQALRQSEANYRLFFEKNSDVVLVADMDGRILDANPAALELYGYSMEELKVIDPGDLMTLEARELMTAETRNPMRPRIEQIRQAGDAMFETAHRRKDGSVVFLEARSGRIVYEGKPATLNVLRDITERKKIEEELQKKQRQLSTMFENVADIMFNLSVEPEDRYRFLAVNDAFLKATGLLENQVVGRHLHEVIPEPSLTLVLKKYKKAIQDGTSVRWEEITDYPAGRKYGEVTVTPVLDSSGQCTNLLGSVHDVTERKAAEENLRRANAELEGFAGTVSHDLRGPLANIGLASAMFMELLAAPQTDQTRTSASQVAEMLQQSSERSIDLVEKLLGLAEAGQAPREVASIDVREVVDGVLEERALDIKGKGIRLEVGVDLGRVVADSTHMYQIFANLIGNAIRYNDSQMPVIKVSHLGDDARGGHRFLLRDNGSGIPTDSLEKIFTPFFKSKAGGTGMGLAIVEKIIRVYGGSIRTYNDNGANFEFTLRDFKE